MRMPLKFSVLILLLIVVSCGRETVVSYETVQGFSPAQGSVMTGYSSVALEEATRLSEVRETCGTPIAEWEEQIPFFARVKRLKYKTYDAHRNVLTTTFTFVGSSSDPSLISIDYGDRSEK